MSTEVGRAGFCLQRVKNRAGFLLPDDGGQGGEAHGGVDAAGLVKHRLAQPHEAKAAAAKWLAVSPNPPGHRLADAALLAHLDADPAAAHFVRDGGGGA